MNVEVYKTLWDPNDRAGDEKVNLYIERIGVFSYRINREGVTSEHNFSGEFSSIEKANLILKRLREDGDMMSASYVGLVEVQEPFMSRVIESYKKIDLAKREFEDVAHALSDIVAEST